MRIGRRSKKTRLGEYLDEVERARRFRYDEGYDDLWAKLREMYEANDNQPAEIGADEDRVAVNMAFSTINVIYPSVSGGVPQISVLANNPAFDQNAVVVQEVLNFAWKHWNVQPAFRRAAKDFLMFGHGWTKVGWRFVEQERQLTNEEITRQYLELRQQTEAAVMINPGSAIDLPNDEEILANIPTTKMEILEDRPFVEHVSVLDMFVNPEATNMDDVRWIAQRVIRHVEDVKNDKNYKASSRKDVGPMLTTYDTFDPRYFGIERGANSPDLCELWEFYDLVDGVMCIFATGGDDFLVDPGQMPYHFGHPFVMIRNYEIPDKFYPIGDLEMLWTLQQELNKTRSDMLNYRAKYARKYVARHSAFNPGDESKIVSKNDGEVIWIRDDTPLDDVIRPLPINELDANLFNWSGQIMADIQEVSGVSEYARGGASARARTATEASLIQDALNARSGEKLAQVETMATDVAGKLLKIMQQFLTGEHVARILGPDGQTKWLPYTRESIIGEFDFTVEAGSTQPNNETFRRQKAIAMMNTLAPFMNMGVIDPYELAKHILTEGFGVRVPEKFMSPQYQQQMMMEQQMMAAEQAGGVGSVPSGRADVGVDAQQPMPQELLQMQQEAMAAQESGGAMPGAAGAQLMGQFGISPML